MQADIFCYENPSAPSVEAAGILAARSVAVQPNVSVRGWPAGAGSMALEGYHALEDATVVRRLREAGAYVKGSTHMSELGLGVAGSTGGRALSEGRVDAALIVDTLGEARVAASMVDAIGFKPSHGIVPRLGLIGIVPSMECCGILAHTPGMIGAVAQAIAGHDEYDFSMPDCEMPDFGGIDDVRAPVRFGVIQQCVKGLDAGEKQAFGSALSDLEQVGEVQDLSLEDYDLVRTVHHVVGSVETSSSTGKYDGVRYGHRAPSAKNWNEMYQQSRAESFGMPAKAYIFQGAYFQFENYGAFENACRIRARLLCEVAACFDRVDLLVLPTRRSVHNAAEAGTIEEIYDAFSLTLLASVTGQPAVQLPGWVLDDGTDLGLQLVGPRLADVRLLSIATRLCRSTRGAV